MAKINPETGEVVDDVSKTAEMRVACIESDREHRRAIADIVSTLEDKAWTRGWIIGVTTGISLTVIVKALWSLVIYP